jgi:hypothetical protein
MIMDNNEKMRERMCVIFALFLIELVTVPTSGAGTDNAVRVFTENDTAGYLPVEILSIDPSIKDSTPGYMFLIMSPEGKETRLNDVNMSIDFLYPGDPQNEVLKADLRMKMIGFGTSIQLFLNQSQEDRVIQPMAAPSSR